MGEAFLTLVRIKPAAFLGRTSLSLRSFGAGAPTRVSLTKHVLQPLLPLCAVGIPSPRVPIALLPASPHQGGAGGGRQRWQEIAPRLAKSWAEVIKREAAGAFQGPTGCILFIAATH